MKDFPSLSPLECAKALLLIDKPLVVMHKNPDGDTVATAGALLEIFRQLGKEPYYASADEIPYYLEFLLSDCTRAYCFDGFSAVSVDVATLSHLGELMGKITPSLSIDHHVTDGHYAPYCSRPAASTGEVLYEVACELEGLGKISVTSRLADLLYASISSDTDRFSLSNASPTTYRYCAELIERGARPATVNRSLFFSKKKEVILAEGFVGLHIKTGGGGKIAYATVSKEDRDSLGLSFSDFSGAIEIVETLRGAEIFLVVKETDEGEYKAWLRSLGRVDVSNVTALHGGTGYSLNAKCSVEAKTASEAAEMLVLELEKII